MSKTSKGLGAGIDQMLASAEEQLVQPKTSGRKEANSREKEVEVTINFKIPKSLHTALKVYVAQEGLSIKELAIKLFSNEIHQSTK